MAVEKDIIEHLAELLDFGDSKTIKSIINEDDFDCVIQQRASELITTASYFFTKETLQNNLTAIKYAEKIVIKCAERGNPKECLLEFLAQIESLDEFRWEYLLKPIQIAMLRIPDRKVSLTQCVFNLTYRFINSLLVPQYHHLDSKSRLLLDCDRKAINIKHVYENLVEFYEPFIEEASVRCEDDRMKSSRMVVMQAIFYLLGKPLVFMDLEDYINGPSEFRSLASVIVKFIHKLKSDFLNLLTLVEDKQLVTVEEEKELLDVSYSISDIKLSDLSLASFFYLVFAEKMLIPDCFVYDKVYIVQNCLALAVTLLRYKERMVLVKGLMLTKVTIETVQPGSLEFSHLSSNVHEQLLNLLSTISIYHEVEEDRRLAIDLVKQHFLIFEPKAQFYVMLNIGNIVSHPNIIGYFITILIKVVQDVFTSSSAQKYFTGKRLFDLLKSFCSLKKGVETDLIENKDQILSALNLIIFLAKRDKENFTKVWDYTDYLNEQFCCPLKEAVKLSRAHFKLELDKINDPDISEQMAELTVRVGEEEQSEMSLEEKKNVLDSGLTVFDLIEHVLTRTTESITDKPSFCS